MLKALLLDLDDTLLVNPVSNFIKAYFDLLSRYMARLIPPQLFIAELMRATKVMQANDGNGPTNEESFVSAFYPAIGHPEEELKPIFLEFYASEFPKLRPLTESIPEAYLLVEWAIGQGLQVAIATNPVFPLEAIEERLRWAGIPTSDHDYALVTSYDTMHAVKPSTAYYEEILAILGREPSECLMVGDDWVTDIEPASAVGIPVYWVIDPSTKPPSAKPNLVGQGTLPQLWADIVAGNTPW